MREDQKAFRVLHMVAIAHGLIDAPLLLTKENGDVIGEKPLSFEIVWTSNKYTGNWIVISRKGGKKLCRIRYTGEKYEIEVLSLSLKKIDYRGHRCLGYENGKVAYLIYRGIIIYSGLSGPDKSTPTLDAFASILQTITQTEHLNWIGEFKVYDIQTHLGYPDIQEGEFVINEVIIEPRSIKIGPEIDSNILPEVIMESFRQFLNPATAK